MLGVWLVGLACGPRQLAVHSPNVTPARAREPTRVELEVFANPAVPVSGKFAAPGPAAALHAAMKAELEGRATHGGPCSAYTVQCGLDRFSSRSRLNLFESAELLVLYADLSCEARCTADGVVTWRGELRGRAAAEASNLLGNDTGTTQRLLDRAASDLAREMTSDLVVRGLGLAAEPSARVFADESQQRASAGLDDSPYGPAALQETSGSADGALRAVSDRDPATRAAAWNALAMASGPGDRWLAGDALRLDDEPLVRFVQYKALARLGGAHALEQLRRAATSESDPLLSEFLRDTIATSGVGLPRSRR